MMMPHLHYAQVRWGHQDNQGSSSGLIEVKDLYFFLDSVRLVYQGGFLKQKEYRKLQEWFHGYLIWLETSEQGKKGYTSHNNHGLYYDIQVLSVSAFIGDFKCFVKYGHAAISRLTGHVSPNGRMEHELKRAICEHYQLFTLQGWENLARILRRMGLNVYEYVTFEDHGMSALCRAAKYSIPYFSNRTECMGNIKEVNEKRWWPLWFSTQSHCLELQGHQPDSPAPPAVHQMPSLYFEHDGIAPFWNLGLK